MKEIIENVNNGAEFQFLCLSTESKKAKWRTRMITDFKDAMERTVGHLWTIESSLPKSKRKKISKTVEYAPDYSLILVNPDDEDGIARIVLYSMVPVARDYKKRTCLMIRKIEHPEVFQNLADQFSTLWNDPDNFKAPKPE